MYSGDIRQDLYLVRRQRAARVWLALTAMAFLWAVCALTLLVGTYEHGATAPNLGHKFDRAPRSGLAAPPRVRAYDRLTGALDRRT